MVWGFSASKLAYLFPAEKIHTIRIKPDATAVLFSAETVNSKVLRYYDLRKLQKSN